MTPLLFIEKNNILQFDSLHEKMHDKYLLTLNQYNRILHEWTGWIKLRSGSVFVLSLPQVFRGMITYTSLPRTDPFKVCFLVSCFVFNNSKHLFILFICLSSQLFSFFVNMISTVDLRSVCEGNWSWGLGVLVNRHVRVGCFTQFDVSHTPLPCGVSNHVLV